MKIFGIDPSTTSIGFCTVSGTPAKPKFYVSKKVVDKKAGADDKFKQTTNQAIAYIVGEKPELVVCEYPFAVHGHGKVLVEQFGAIRYHCLINGVLFLPLSQSRIKKYATGEGGAEKSALVLRAFKEYGLELSDDEADAFWIAHVGLSFLHGSPVKHRQASVDDIKKKLSKEKNDQKPARRKLSKPRE